MATLSVANHTIKTVAALVHGTQNHMQGKRRRANPTRRGCFRKGTSTSIDPCPDFRRFVEERSSPEAPKVVLVADAVDNRAHSLWNFTGIEVGVRDFGDMASAGADGGAQSPPRGRCPGQVVVDALRQSAAGRVRQ